MFAFATMSTKNDGGAAFPVACPNGTMRNEGISMRDYFAAKAMQGLLAKHGAYFEDREHSSLCSEKMARDAFESALLIGEVCVYSYEVADAMLAERAK